MLTACFPTRTCQRLERVMHYIYACKCKKWQRPLGLRCRIVHNPSFPYLEAGPHRKISPTFLQTFAMAFLRLRVFFLLRSFFFLLSLLFSLYFLFKQLQQAVFSHELHGRISYLMCASLNLLLTVITAWWIYWHIVYSQVINCEIIQYWCISEFLWNSYPWKLS